MAGVRPILTEAIVEEELPGTKMIYIDKVNPADRPGVTIPQLVDDMVEEGCEADHRELR